MESPSTGSSWTARPSLLVTKTARHKRSPFAKRLSTAVQRAALDTCLSPGSRYVCLASNSCVRKGSPSIFRAHTHTRLRPEKLVEKFGRKLSRLLILLTVSGHQCERLHAKWNTSSTLSRGLVRPRAGQAPRFGPVREEGQGAGGSYAAGMSWLSSIISGPREDNVSGKQLQARQVKGTRGAADFFRCCCAREHVQEGCSCQNICGHWCSVA